MRIFHKNRKKGLPQFQSGTTWTSAPNKSFFMDWTPLTHKKCCVAEVWSKTGKMGRPWRRSSDIRLSCKKQRVETTHGLGISNLLLQQLKFLLWKKHPGQSSVCEQTQILYTSWFQQWFWKVHDSTELLQGLDSQSHAVIHSWHQLLPYQVI